MRSCKRWIELVCAGVVACAGLEAVAADPVVSNVRAAQRAGTGLFDITYDLADADSSVLSVTVAISTNNGAAWFEAASSNLTGAVGSYSVSPGTGKTVVWQGGRELPARLFPSVTAKITADDSPPPPPLYLVVNLSGGTNASSYPVTYYATSTAVPGGANSDAYKTDRLLMRLIPKGSFTMGSPSGELEHYGDETQHAVTLTKDFYIGVFEVTQRQWELVMGSKPSYFNNAAYYASRPVEQVSYYEIRENPEPMVDQWTKGSAISPNCPASSQVHVDSFMGKLRAKTGLDTFDLPTESQWEYACRAGTTTALNSGKSLTNPWDTDPQLNEVGRYWYNGGSGFTQSGTAIVGTAKVGTYLPNTWGLYDMHGNAWEWCLDWYEYFTYSVTDPVGAASGAYRVIRGGSWGNFASFCRSARRFSEGSYPSSRDGSVGFRTARTLP